MSRVVKIKSALKRNRNRAFLRVVLLLVLTVCFSGFGLGLLIAILLKKSTVHIAVSVALLVLGFVCLTVFFIYKRQYSILLSGVRGEDAALKILQRLPKSFTIIKNPVILNRGVTMELDFVVVGRNGVFVVETKNHRGILSGKTSKPNWKQIKHGKNDKVYEKEISNPVKQSYRQNKRLEELFKDFDISATIFPVLYFVDNRTELKIYDDAETGVAIFNDSEKLLHYIENTKGRNGVSDNELTKIKRIFKK